MMMAPLRLLLLLTALTPAPALAKPRHRVIRGRNARPLEFPSMAMLLVQHDALQYAVCAGTLVKPQVVLTAAHCIDYIRQRDINSTVFVVLGGHNVTLAGREPGAQTIPVADTVPHPLYVGAPKFAFDAMLLCLDRPAHLSKDPSAGVRLSRLPAPDLALASAVSPNCFIVGWGLVNITSRADVLQKGDMDLVVDGEEKLRYQNPSIVYARPGGRRLASGCRGDSGGALFCPPLGDGAPVQVGTVSGGKGACGSTSDLVRFANLRFIRDWIDDTLCSFDD